VSLLQAVVARASAKTMGKVFIVILQKLKMMEKKGKVKQNNH
jgi:hypothetical protein